jgi:DNA mismatch repair protein MSH5
LLDPDAVSITFLHMQVMFTSSTGQILDPASSHHFVKPTLNSANASQDQDHAQSARKGEKITYLYRQAKRSAVQSARAHVAFFF